MDDQARRGARERRVAEAVGARIAPLIRAPNGYAVTQTLICDVPAAAT